MKVAILCSGQGSQFRGMGLDFLNEYPEITPYFEKTSYAISDDVLFVLEDEKLINKTEYTQPLMVLTSTVIYQKILDLGIKPEGIAGFSLGEYTALHLSGAFDFETIQDIVNFRAQVMKEASSKYPGKMAAVLGLASQEIEKVCLSVSNHDNVVVAANYNMETQTVISGSPDAVDKATEKLKELGAKRVLPLNVSGAFHSPYMEQAGVLLKKHVKNYPYSEPKFPIYLNTKALPLDANDNLYDIMENQIKSPVKFLQTINQMIKDGYTHFIEVGPGSVLTNLVKKINPDVFAHSVSQVSDLEKLKEALSC